MTLLLSTCLVVLLPFVAHADKAADLNQFIDAWHHAAAVADEDVFFGSMDEDAVYLGTDATERWTRDAFMSWGMKYFERDVAWAFDPFDRHVYFSPDDTFAWWEEYLDTWMGVCGGSGVARLEEGEWKILHYHLAVTVPNDDIREFMAIVDNPADREGTDEHAVMAVIKGMFAAVQSGEADRVAGAFTPGARMVVVSERAGATGESSNDVADFVETLRNRTAQWREPIWEYRVRIDGALASVWTHYAFYIDDRLSHCGIDSFHLIREEGHWRIAQIAYTRRTEGCGAAPTEPAEPGAKRGSH